MKIILVDNSTHPVKCFGYIKFHLDSRESIFLHDVMYVPRLKKNLVSISTLEDKGMSVSFIKGKVLTWPIGSFTRDAFTMGSIFEGLYRVTNISLLKLAHDTNHISEIWHQILTHLHYNSLPKMKKLVSEIPDVQAHHDGVYIVCSIRNNTRGPFPTSKNKTNDNLQVIHSDICGPMPIHLIGIHIYYITFIDDFSRNMWIYYLKHKDEAFEMFKEIKALVENQTGKKIKIFRSNNDGEYTSNEFIDFCKKEDIKKETIMPYSP